MAHKSSHDKKKIDTHKLHHPEGMVKYAAKTKLKVLTRKQIKNVKRGRKGHTPIPRKVLR